MLFCGCLEDLKLPDKSLWVNQLSYLDWQFGIHILLICIPMAYLTKLGHSHYILQMGEKETNATSNIQPG